jgi:replicative DNA helicase
MNSPEKKTKESVGRQLKKASSSVNYTDHGRIPPQAPDLEEAVLGAMMLEQDALTNTIDILKPEVFYKEAHQKICAAIAYLFKESLPVDILTVTNELQKRGELEVVGGSYYISQLTNRVASAANIEFHARIVIEKFLQRELIRISSDIIKESYENTHDVFDTLDRAEQDLFNVSETNLRRSYSDMKTLLRESITNIENAKNQEGHITGVPTGFSELDRMTAGWQKADLVVLAARPGMGKTAFVLSMARNVAVQFKRPTVVFSLEMTGVQLVTRLIASESEIAADKLRRGQLTDNEWKQLNERISELTDAPLYIDDTPALTIFELRAKCRRLKAKHNIQLVIIDYLQLMSGSGDNKGNREQEISNISRSLKSLAKELGVPIIALSQLSRAVETRGGTKRPILSDLRESGAIEQDADMVMFIYRPEYYQIFEDGEGNSTERMGELIIAKHRNGALGTVKLTFLNELAKFTDYEPMPYLPGENNFKPSNTFHSDDSGAPSNFMTRPSKMNDFTEDDEHPF